MRFPFPPEVEAARLVGPSALRWESRPGDDYGAFFFRRKGVTLKVIASAGSEEIPWEHVSISTKVRTPTWEEMAWLKGLFFDDEETVVQYHPPKSRYVNHHPFCLHLWRPIDVALPLPPTIAVGPVSQSSSEPAVKP